MPPTATATPLPTPGPAPTDFPTDFWFRAGGWSCKYKADGTYVCVGDEGEWTGTWTVTGDQFSTKVRACGDEADLNIWAYDGEVLSFRLIHDPCTGRRAQFQPEWTRKP